MQNKMIKVRRRIHCGNGIYIEVWEHPCGLWTVNNREFNAGRFGRNLAQTKHETMEDARDESDRRIESLKKTFKK